MSSTEPLDAKGTGVHITPKYAGFWRRLAASLLDLLIVAPVSFLAWAGVFTALFFLTAGMILIPLFFLLESGESGEGDRFAFPVIGGLVAVLGFLLMPLYGAVMESTRWQGTVGKRVLGIKVTDLDGKRISFWRSLGRNLGKAPSFLLLLIGFVMAGLTEKKQTLHDKMAGCLVVMLPPGDMVSFPTAISLGFQRYFDFGSRSTRAEYWWWFLFVVLANLMLSVIAYSVEVGYGLLHLAFGLATLIPALALGSRRLHDINKSGWWLLLCSGIFLIVPVIVLVVWAIKPSGKETNRYGSAPRHHTSQYPCKP